MSSYYNTNGEKGPDLAKSEEKAQTQEDILMGIFKNKRDLSASQAFKLFPNGNTPITSIRRAITNLTNQGKLIKTQDLRPGLYGKDEHVYKVNKNPVTGLDKNGQMTIL